MPYPWFDDRLSEDGIVKQSAEFFEKMNRRRTVRKIQTIEGTKCPPNTSFEARINMQLH